MNAVNCACVSSYRRYRPRTRAALESVPALHHIFRMNVTQFLVSKYGPKFGAELRIRIVRIQFLLMRHFLLTTQLRMSFIIRVPRNNLVALARLEFFVNCCQALHVLFVGLGTCARLRVQPFQLRPCRAIHRAGNTARRAPVFS